MEDAQRQSTVYLVSSPDYIWCYDYRNRVWEERNQLADDAVANWDIGTYRLAEARLRILAPTPDLMAALTAVRKTGAALGEAWRLSPADKASIESALSAHNDAVGQFIAVSSKLALGHSALRWPRREVRA
ncbi:MAG TPA: hypothetical protein VIX15_01770 [Streptosporangiaceae bacterium]